MGYYSTVYIATTKEHGPELFALLAKHNLLDSSSNSMDDSNTYFTLSDLKWYGSYPEVDAVNAFISNLGESACLLRVGEDPNDVESIGDTYYYGFEYYMQVDYPYVEDNSYTEFIKTHHPEIYLLKGST